MPLSSGYDRNAHRVHVDSYLAADIKTATRPRWSASRIIAAAEAAGWTVWDFNNDLHVTGTLVIEQSGVVQTNAIAIEYLSGEIVGARRLHVDEWEVNRKDAVSMTSWSILDQVLCWIKDPW